jgi:16S rRNA (cytidine1402-2'-O)-methyltransferase
MSGTLYVVATPIGNLEDISSRALGILRTVSLIACEDTRVTAKLLSRYDIRARKVSYHEHNEKRRAAQLVEKLSNGQDIALVSDAGTPGVSDPGYRLVSEARKKGIPVRSLPGPSAALAALAVSGLPTSSFCFYGFLPTRGAARRRALDSLASSSHTSILFESARRAPNLIEQLANRLGPRPAFVAREMTKIHEEHRFGTLPELALWAREKSLRGELTVVVSASNSTARGRFSSRQKSIVSESKDEPSPTIELRFQELSAQGLSRREAAKQIAREVGQPSRQIYRTVIQMEEAKREGLDEDA